MLETGIILKRLYEKIKPAAQNLRIADLRIGLSYVGIKLDNESAGLAAVLRPRKVIHTSVRRINPSVFLPPPGELTPPVNHGQSIVRRRRTHRHNPHMHRRRRTTAHLRRRFGKNHPETYLIQAPDWFYS